MKKAISTSFYGEGNPNNYVTFMGCLETFKWKAVRYDGGPNKSGRYVTTDGCGKMRVFNYATENDGGVKELFWRVLDSSNAMKVFEDGKSREATNDDFMRLARSWFVWYDVYHCHDRYDYDYEETYEICFGEADEPRYYLDIDLDDQDTKIGPIDEELDTYESEEYDSKKW